MFLRNVSLGNCSPAPDFASIGKSRATGELGFASYRIGVRVAKRLPQRAGANAGDQRWTHGRNMPASANSSYRRTRVEFRLSPLSRLDRKRRTESFGFALVRLLGAQSKFPLRIRDLDSRLPKPLDDRVVQVASHREAVLDIGDDASQFEFKGAVPEPQQEGPRGRGRQDSRCARGTGGQDMRSR